MIARWAVQDDAGAEHVIEMRAVRGEKFALAWRCSCGDRMCMTAVRFITQTLQPLADKGWGYAVVG